MTSPVSGSTATGPQRDVQKLFHEAIGGTFYRQMLAALRSSTGKAAYFDGGQGEKIFQAQFDELIVERLSQSNGHVFAADLFEQWNRNRHSRPIAEVTAAEEAGLHNQMTPDAVTLDVRR